MIIDSRKKPKMINQLNLKIMRKSMSNNGLEMNIKQDDDQLFQHGRAQETLIVKDPLD